MRAPGRHQGADRGAVAIEAAIVLPVLLALGLLFLAGGRVALAAQKTDAAAEAGQEKKGAVSMSALLQSCAAASAVSTPPELPTPRAA